MYKTLSKISETTDTAKSGQLTKYLNDLVESGFIWKDKVFSLKTGKELRSARFRLKDNYLRFYLKYIEPLADKIRSGLYKGARIEALTQWETIMGLQFENLILNNIPLLLKALSINPNAVTHASPYYQKKNSRP